MTAGRPTIASAGPPQMAVLRPGIRATREELLAKQGTGQSVFIDVRSVEEFRGELPASPHLL